MRKFGLQMFAEAVSGKKIVYLYRVESEKGSEDAAALAFTTENGRTKSKDADSKKTKDGSIRTPGTAETSVTASSILTKGDTLISKLEKAMDDDKLIEVWEVNLEEKGTGSDASKFKAKYYQGYLTNVGIASSAEDMVTVSLTFGLNGKGADGYATVTEEQQEAAVYVFADTKKTGA